MLQISIVDWPGGRIPEFLRDLATVAVAVISRDGQLRDGNLGFVNLLPSGAMAEDFLDIRDMFINPRFDHFAVRRPERPGRPIYRGILTLGDPVGLSTSVQAAVYALPDSVLLVAEHEVASLELLRQRVLQLNEDLAEEQRKLACALRELQQRTVATDDASCDRQPPAKRPDAH